MIMMRVSVTGGSGLLGRRLVRFLRESGYGVLSHSRGPDTDLRGDLVDPREAERLLHEALPQAIVHLVSLTNVDDCERDPDRAFRYNVRTVENLAAAMKAHRPAPHLVLISTDQVYDAPGANLEDAVVLRNTYALTKFWAERVALEVNATVLRTNFFGKSDTPGRKSLSDWIIERAVAHADITLFTDVRFSPLSVETLCAAIRRVLEWPQPGVFNAGSRQGMSKRDFAHLLARRLQLDLDRARDVTTDYLPLPARRPHNMIMDSQRFEKTFEFTMPTLEHEIQTAEV